MAIFNSSKPESSSGVEGFSINSISNNSVFTGNIVTDQDIRIDGTLNGDLACKARLIIGEKGMVTGNVQCNAAMIYGKMEGQIHVEGQLEAFATARITGDVTIRSLIIHEGAHFNVQCNMESIVRAE